MMEGCLVMRTSATSAPAGAASASASAAPPSHLAIVAIAFPLFVSRTFRRNRCANALSSDSGALRAPLAIPRHRLGVRRIRAGQCAALLDFGKDEFLEQVLLQRILRDTFGEMAGHDDHTVSVAHDDIPRIHRDAAAPDRNVEIDRVMARQI